MKFDSLASSSFGADMFDTFAWLREHDPVHWDEKNQLFVLSRYEDVFHVSKHREIFCSGEGVRPSVPTKLSIIDMDEPRHGQLRKLVNRGFTPRMVGKLEIVFRELTTAAIDRIAQQGACDFVEAISAPMPLEIIAEMIGIEKKDRDRFKQWSDDMIRAEGNFDQPEVVAAAGKAFADYGAYLQDVFEDRRRNPQDDLVSILVGAHREGVLGQIEDPDAEEVSEELTGGLASDELLMFMVLLLVAGNETTRNAMSGGMSALIENPDQRELLVRDPALIKSAVEEIVRYVSPVLSFARTATVDTELRGVPIRAGQKVLMLYPSANRDPAVFDEPDRFRIDRSPNPHLGFGIGNHFCLGANLARMELRVVLEEVLRRLPDMEYADGPPRLDPSALVRSFVSMPVRFSPERRAA